MAILENRQDKISPWMSGLITGLYEDWVRLNERIETIAGEIETIETMASLYYSAWRPDADRRAKLLIYQTMEGQSWTLIYTLDSRAA